ncbi:MAG TPA: hypothetical protein VLM38_17255 [Blastocatellia bacterium]|nr:hypothetical protein [Blastocatellia bacterium]
MRFSRTVFVAAGIWGVLIVSPLYFLESMINEQQPPPITHPEYYYGFAGVTLVWQILFFVIARNPIRYRPMMLIAILEKLSYCPAAGLLFAAGRVPSAVFLVSLPDLVWAALFAIAYWKTPASDV